MDKKLATVVFIAVAAETPNKLLLKARQEAYELVTKQAKDLLEKQRKSYEDQCARMAEEHHKCMERMKRETGKATRCLKKRPRCGRSMLRHSY